MFEQALQDEHGFYTVTSYVQHRKSVYLSVIMSAYNAAQYLSTALHSILRQSYHDLEIIVVNDGSIDSTNDIIHRFLKFDARVILINQPNIGLTASLNRAFLISSGVYIARHDADDYSFRLRFELQIKALNLDGTIGALGCNVLKLVDNKINRPSRHNRSAVGQVLSIGSALRFRNCMAHGGVIIRRSVLQQLNGYDVRFTQTQDFDLWHRVLKAGYRVCKLQEPLYILRCHAISVSVQNILNQTIFASIIITRYWTNKHYLESAVNTKDLSELALSHNVLKLLVVAQLLSKNYVDVAVNFLGPKNFLSRLINSNANRKAIIFFRSVIFRKV